MRERREPRILARPEHQISRKNISENTLKVLYRLNNQGYKAYLVGGGVRDLMLGRAPKDFDIGTDARPNDVRRLFRNSRIIGRRFRLVHVFFQGGEVVEVSTFRREPDPNQQNTAEGELLITDDNTFGTPREDAFRRDFTVNAMFYDISDFSVIDYVGGIEDLERGMIRVIGQPGVRFQEDPVRMLRACEFAARLGFGIDGRTQEGIHEQRETLELASPVRITEEIVDMLRCGSAARAIQWLMDLDLLEVILPEAYDMVAVEQQGLGRFDRLPGALDDMINDGQTVSDAAVLASLLLPRALLRRYEIESVDRRPMSRTAIEELTGEIVAPFISRLSISRDRSARMGAALAGFHRLAEPNLSAKAQLAVARRPWFDDALTLFEMLVRATGEGYDALDPWRRALELRGEVDTRAQEERKERSRSRRRRRRRPGRR